MEKFIYAVVSIHDGSLEDNTIFMGEDKEKTLNQAIEYFLNRCRKSERFDEDKDKKDCLENWLYYDQWECDEISLTELGNDLNIIYTN